MFIIFSLVLAVVLFYCEIILEFKKVRLFEHTSSLRDVATKITST